MCAKLASAILGFLGTAILMMPAYAQDAPTSYRESEESRRACTPDVFRLCSEFIPDATQITMCLQQKVRFLSPGCRAVFTNPADAGPCSTGSIMRQGRACKDGRAAALPSHQIRQMSDQETRKVL